MSSSPLSFLRQAQFERFMGRCLTGREIREIVSSGTRPDYAFVLTNYCCLELRPVRTLVASLRIRQDKLTDARYLPYLGEARGPLHVYDPVDGSELPRVRIYVPENANFETQRIWFRCFSEKKPPGRYELRWMIVSLNYVDLEEYWEIQEIMPVRRGESIKTSEERAVSLAFRLMEIYLDTEKSPSRSRFLEKQKAGKVGMVRDPILIDSLITPTESMIIDKKYNKLRRVYDVDWIDKTQNDLFGNFIGIIPYNPRTIREVALLEEEKSQQAVMKRWRKRYFGESGSGQD